MASQCAAVLTPGYSNQTSFYYLLGSGQLAFEHRPVEGQYKPHVSNDPLEGPIHNPGSMAVAVRQGVAYVYAFTKPQQPALEGQPVPRKPVISRVSPICNPITPSGLDKTPDTASSYPGLAACSDGETTDYIYFIKDVIWKRSEDDDPIKIQRIHETTISTNVDTTTKPLGDTMPWVKSRLTSLLLPQKWGRLIIYQSDPADDDPYAKLYFVNPLWNSGNPQPIVNTAASAMNATPLAIVSEKFSKDSHMLKVHLYYLGVTTRLVMRVSCLLTEKSENEAKYTWGQASVVNGPSTVPAAQDSGIAAVCDGNHNHIFYRQKGTVAFTSIKESLDDISMPTPIKEDD